VARPPGLSPFPEVPHDHHDPSTALVPAAPPFSNTERLALAGFLAGYSGLTREAYELDLRQFASWCHQHHLRLFAARRAGIAKPVGPHTLRHAFITAALDAGVPLRDVQEAASHADPRTTTRYDRARASLDRHATYIVVAYIAGAAR
jgi:integrase